MGAATGLLSGGLFGRRSSGGGISGGFSLPGGGGGLHEAGHFRGYRDGGRWDKDLGRWVVTGEDGEELLVADDGTTRRLGVGGPELVKVDKPGVVIPAKRA